MTRYATKSRMSGVFVKPVNDDRHNSEGHPKNNHVKGLAVSKPKQLTHIFVLHVALNA